MWLGAAAVEVPPSPKLHEREAIEPSLSVLVSVSDAAAVLEGNTGTIAMTFNVRLSNASGTSVLGRDVLFSNVGNLPMDVAVQSEELRAVPAELAAERLQSLSIPTFPGGTRGHVDLINQQQEQQQQWRVRS